MGKYYDKTAASFKSVTIDTKVLDAQKILINSNPNDINQRENLLDVLNRIDVTPSYISYQYIDYCEKSSNTGECSAVKLHANLLPHGKKIKAIRLDVANTVNTETWLVAYLVDANNNFTSIGKSINSNTWSAGDQVEWEFNKAFQIPEGNYLQLYIADANSTISSNNVTRPSYKIKLYVADHSGDNQDSVRYDGTWYSQRRVYVQFKEELKQELSQYLDYKLNEVESNLDQVQEQVNTNTESIYSIGQDVETNSENIESLRQDVNSLFTYQDAVRDINTMQGTLDNATIYGIQYSKAHFGIYGTQISKVTLPYNTQSDQSNTGYLVAQVFGHDNQLMVSYYSEGTHTFSNAGPAVFDFKDAYIATNYKFIRFILVTNNTVALPTAYNSVNSNCLSFRARPIKWQDSFVFDDDDCLSYSNQSTGTQNWLIGMTIDYKERIAPAMDNFVTREELNEQLENLEPQEIDTSNLAKLNTSNTFTGDIVIRGSKLILANGAQLEIEEGDYITGEPGTNMAPSIAQLQQDVEQLRTDMTQADSSLQNQINNIPNLTDDVNDLTQRVIDLEQGNSGGSGTSDYTEVKEDVEYHLQNKMTHMSFTDRIVMDNLYTVEEGSFSKYYTSNNVDNVTEFTDAVCSSFTLHTTSILLDTTLGVLQIPYSGSADVQCSLKLVCYDDNTKTNLIEVTSTNVVDYSTGAGNANFFFEPFVLPFKTEEVVCSFVKADGTNVQVPVKLVTTTPTNGDQYNNQDSYVDGRVYVLQYTPSVHINTLIRDLDDCRWPMLTLQEDGSYSIAYDTFVGMRSISLTPHPENGNSIVVNNLGLGLNSGFTAVNGAEPTFFSCMCVFTNMTEEAYVKLNGHTLYTGAEDGGLSFSDQLSSPFQIDMLLGPGDTIEISPYVQLRAIRFTGGRYV